MIKQFMLSLGLLAATIVPSFAWDIDKMNEQIEKTNVIVSAICSGTIIDTEKRLVLTAHHCITGSLKTKQQQKIDPKTGIVSTITVEDKDPMYIEILTRHNGKTVSKETHLASIAGYDEATDVAILKIDDPNWKPEMQAPLAPDTYEFKRGQTVFAVGNPGIIFDNTITTGIISHPGRDLEMGTGYVIPFFQHSASIMGGSSGGAIYNDSGELIGTVSAGVRGADIGLAVPISKTKELLKRIGY